MNLTTTMTRRRAAIGRAPGTSSAWRSSAALKRPSAPTDCPRASGVMSHRYAPWPAVISLAELSGSCARAAEPTGDRHGGCARPRRREAASHERHRVGEGHRRRRHGRPRAAGAEDTARPPGGDAGVPEKDGGDGRYGRHDREPSPNLGPPVGGCRDRRPRRDGEAAHTPEPKRAECTARKPSRASLARRAADEDARLAPSHAPGAFTDPIPATISRTIAWATWAPTMGRPI